MEAQSEILTAEFGREGRKGFRRDDPLVGSAIQAVGKKDGGKIKEFLDVLSILDKITSAATKSKELLLPLVTHYGPLLLDKVKEHFK